VLAQTGVRHFVGAGPLTALRWLFQASPDRLVHWLVGRTCRVLLADIGPDQQFWTNLLRSILYTELTKPDLVAMMAAISDFTAHHRPKPGDLTGWSRPVLVLQSERDRAFAAQADEIRAAYPSAVFHIIAGAGHGALFSHTDRYLTEPPQTFHETCRCGLPFRFLDPVEVRNDDVLSLPGQTGGLVRVHPVGFHQTLDLLDVAGWQVRQHNNDLRILVASPGPALRHDSCLR
jgi:hypothetical protein